MSTVAFVLGSALVVATQLAVAIVHYDGSAISDKASRIEDHLDRELHDWMSRSLDLEPDGARATGEAAPAGSPS